MCGTTTAIAWVYGNRESVGELSIRHSSRIVNRKSLFLKRLKLASI
jgi:hypothetical protein